MDTRVRVLKYACKHVHHIGHTDRLLRAYAYPSSHRTASQHPRDDRHHGGCNSMIQHVGQPKPAAMHVRSDATQPRPLKGNNDMLFKHKTKIFAKAINCAHVPLHKRYCTSFRERRKRPGKAPLHNLNAAKILWLFRQVNIAAACNAGLIIQLVFDFCDNSMREKDWRCRKRGMQATGDVSPPGRSRWSDTRAAPVL